MSQIILGEEQHYQLGKNMELKKIKFEEIRNDVKSHDFITPFENNKNIYSIIDNNIEKGICIYQPVLNADDFIQINLLFIYDEFRNSSIGSMTYDLIMKNKKCGRAYLFSDIARTALLKKGWKISSKHDNLLYKS